MTAEQVSEANELYWTSDASVADIAEGLGVSRGTLYGVVEPQPVGLRCPQCEGALTYANRTARDNGEASCESCELELDREAVREVAEGRFGGARAPGGSAGRLRGDGAGEGAGRRRVAGAEAETSAGGGGRAGRSRATAPIDTNAALRRTRALGAGLAAAAGMAVGALAVFLSRD